MELKRDWLVKQAHLARSYQISSAISSVKSYLSQIRRSKINPMGVCPLSRPRLQCHLVGSHSPGHSRCKSPLYCGSAHLSSPSLSSDRLPYFTWRTFYTALTRGSLAFYQVGYVFLQGGWCITVTFSQNHASALFPWTSFMCWQTDRKNSRLCFDVIWNFTRSDIQVS